MMTQVERARERAMALGISTGLLLCLVMLATGIWSQSLTLLADAIRAVLLTSLDCCVFVVLRRIHRGQLAGYEYGVGKLEYFLNLLVAGALILAAVWLVGLGAISMTRVPQPPPFGLDVAFGIAAVNTVQNIVIFAALRRAGRDGTSIIINGQVRSRLTKLVSSVVAMLAILVSAIFQGEKTGLIADLSGMSVVVLVMLRTAFGLIEAALPHLLDRILDEPQQNAINRVLIRYFHDYDRILRVRTRRSGNIMFVEIELGYEPQRTMGEVDRVNESIVRELTALIPGASVSITAMACAAAAPYVSNRVADPGAAVARAEE